MSFCPHCHSGHDPVLVQSTWSCGVRYNDPSWRTKECYKRNLELANERIKRLEEGGDRMASMLKSTRDHWYSTDQCEVVAFDWDETKKAKEAKP